MQAAQTFIDYDELTRCLGLDPVLEITSVLDDPAMGQVRIIVTHEGCPEGIDSFGERVPGVELDLYPVSVLRPMGKLHMQMRAAGWTEDQIGAAMDAAAAHHPVNQGAAR